MASKLIQPPDASPTGLGTLFSQYAAYFHRLADDWTCDETGEISKVTLWVSFLNDMLPQGGLAGVHLSVHADIPADPPQEPRSKPGAPLAQWDLGPSEFALTPHVGPVSGHFWDPLLGQHELGADTQVWQLDCFVPQGQRFIQQEGAMYWLCASVDAGDGGATLCGWKTCPAAPGAAVWTDDQLPGPPPASWTAMQDPAWHQRPGAPLGLSFAIEAVPTPPPPGAARSASAAPPPDPVPHPADAGNDWSCDPTGVLAYAAGWLGGAALEFQGVNLAGPGVAQAYILRAAAIAMASLRARYEDTGGAEPIDSAAHPRRWRELPDDA